jgi:predicted secreted protein
LLALASLTLAACGNLNTDKLEGVTKDEIQKDVGVTVAKVDCPGDVKAAKGVDFTCTATAKDGSTAKIEVVQTDDQGNVNWNVTGAS